MWHLIRLYPVSHPAILDTSTGHKMEVSRLEEYSKDLKCSNILGKFRDLNIYDNSQFWGIMDTLSRGGKFQNCFASLLKGIYSKRKEFAPHGSKFFPFRVDSFSDGARFAELQTGSHKICLPWKNGKFPIAGCLVSFYYIYVLKTFP